MKMTTVGVDTFSGITGKPENHADRNNSSERIGTS